MAVWRSVTLTCPPAFQRREHHEQIGDAIAFVFVIVTRWLSRFGGDRRARVDDQLLRGFVEAHERALRIVRSLIDFQDVFHGGDKRRVGVGRNHPLLLAMRLENVFFSVRPIVLSLARSTMCSSTTFSSSRRRLHLAKPSGTGESVSAISFASAAPSKIRRRAEFELYFAGQHRLEPFLDQLAPGPLDSGDAGVQRRGDPAVAPASRSSASSLTTYFLTAISFP